jgi:hypothetical protein
MADDEIVDYYYDCSDEEELRLLRRKDGRRGEHAGERHGVRLNRALLALCDEVERDEGVRIELAEGDIPEGVRRKARIPMSTLLRVNELVARLPGVSRNQFSRVAIRRWVQAFVVAFTVSMAEMGL